jgi:glutamate synthase (ferredoxin)
VFWQVILPSPVLLENELEAIRTKTGLKNKTLSLHYKSGSMGALADALRQLCNDAEAAVKDGCEVLILSDHLQGEELDPDMPPIPTLLGVGAVHHHLIRCTPWE